MSKVIPPREGQKLNGIAPSIFALAFLLVGIPFASTYIISAGTYFADDPVKVGYERQDIANGPYPFYERSGDGPDSKCESQYPALPGWGANCTTSFNNWGITEFSTYNSTWHQKLTGCADGSTGSTPISMDCGDSGYKITQNITNWVVSDSVFPKIEYRFLNEDVRTCDYNHMGDSKVDYTITFNLVLRTQNWWGTNIWMSQYIEDSVSMSGTHSFNNSVESVSFSSGMPPVPFFGCSLQVEAEHEMDFIELDQVSRLMDEHFNNIENSFGIYITIELDDLRREDNRKWSQVNFFNPFHGDNASTVEMYLEFEMYESAPINTVVRLGVFGMGIVFWLIAIASTPYWDPFVKKYNEVRAK